MTYYLVSPVNANPGGRKHFFWMLDNGDTWVGVARGIWRPKHKNDLVKESAEAEHITRLDWTKTPFHNDSLASGWLSRDGRFYGCPKIFHDTFAAIVLGMKVGELEKTGWTRVLDENRYVCEKRLSAEQKNWLSGNGYSIIE